MTSIITESGYKNSVGFFDRVAKQLVIKHPCTRKKDAQEVYAWIEKAKTTGLRSVAISVGMLDGFFDENSDGYIYDATREMVHGIVDKTKSVEAAFLIEVFVRLEKCVDIEDLTFKCISFKEHVAVFEMLLKNIRVLKKLRCLDLKGSFFDSEQLVDLADFVSRTKVAKIVWPDTKLDDETVSVIADKLEANVGLVDLSGAPVGLRKIAKRNRRRFFKFLHDTSKLTDSEALMLKEYKDSVSGAIAYERKKLDALNDTFGGFAV